jgi:hypothetical protein
MGLTQQESVQGARLCIDMGLLRRAYHVRAVSVQLPGDDCDEVLERRERELSRFCTKWFNHVRRIDPPWRITSTEQ